MSELSENVRAVLGGDKTAFDALYGATSRAVYFTCLSLVHNETDAEDITQEVYITAFEKLAALNDPEKFPAWINRIAVNRCKDFLAKKTAHPEQSIDSEGAFGELIDENILPEEYVENKEKRRLIMDIMRSGLSDAQYQTVILFYFNDMSIAEIAEVMDCPEGTVKYRLNTARARIKQGVLDYEHRTDDTVYSFAGAPFLARLLTAESESVAVPLLKTAAPKIAAAASKVGRKAFLSTLKGKIIAGAAAAAVIGGGAAIAVTVDHAPSDSVIQDGGSFDGSVGGTDTAENGMDEPEYSPVSKPQSGTPDPESDPPVTAEYEYVEIDGGIRITKYHGNDEVLTVPAEIDGKKVLEIDNGNEFGFLFFDTEREADIKEIFLPEGLTKIGDYAFAYLSELEAVHIPESVTSLGGCVFLECARLENVVLPEGLTELNYTFDHCASLSEITVPESAEVLFAAFGDCTSLTHVVIPENVREIDYAFGDCADLKEVTFLGAALEDIGLGAFENCTSLESIVIPDGVEAISLSAFSGCTSLKSVTLPDSLESIEIKAFEGCTSLKEIVLPDGIRDIASNAFEGCTGIRITFRGRVYGYEDRDALFSVFDKE